MVLRDIRELLDDVRYTNITITTQYDEYGDNDDEVSIQYQNDDSFVENDLNLSSRRNSIYHHPHASIVRSRKCSNIKSNKAGDSSKRRKRSINNKIGSKSTSKKPATKIKEVEDPKNSTTRKRKRAPKQAEQTRQTVHRKKRNHINESESRMEVSNSRQRSSHINRQDSPIGSSTVEGEVNEDSLDIESSNNEIDANLASDPLITEDSIFEDLDIFNGSLPQQGHETNDTSDPLENQTVNEICDSLTVMFPTNEQMSCKCLRQLPVVLCNPYTLDGNAHYISAQVFQTIHKLLHLTGSFSLQELNQTESPHACLHVELFISLLKLLKQDLNTHLRESDGAIFDVFSPQRKNKTMEFIMLQIIDVLYSQLLPEEWGMPLIISNDFLDSLKKLRDELGTMLHLTEQAVYLLLKKFKRQQWQRSNHTTEGRKWYVSSISSDECSDFWKDSSTTQGELHIQSSLLLPL